MIESDTNECYDFVIFLKLLTSKVGMNIPSQLDLGMPAFYVIYGSTSVVGEQPTCNSAPREDK